MCTRQAYIKIWFQAKRCCLALPVAPRTNLMARYLFHTGQGKLLPLADVMSVGFDLYHRNSDGVYRLDFELNPLLDQFLCPYKPYNERKLET